MKNITVSLDDELYHAARVAAAQQKTNVPALLRRYLSAFVKGEAPLPSEPEQDPDHRNREELVRLLSECKLELGYRPTRKKTYAR